MRRTAGSDRNGLWKADGNREKMGTVFVLEKSAADDVEESRTFVVVVVLERDRRGEEEEIEAVVTDFFIPPTDNFGLVVVVDDECGEEGEEEDIDVGIAVFDREVFAATFGDGEEEDEFGDDAVEGFVMETVFRLICVGDGEEGSICTAII